jgi:hypothetical protein
MPEFPPPKLTPLDAAIDELLGILASAATIEICIRVSTIWISQGPEAVQKTGLSSPQRQTFYLLGLLMTTPEPLTQKPLPKGSWERIIGLLNVITDSYMKTAIAGVETGGIDPKKSSVAALAFAQRFMSGRLAVAEQLERLVRGSCAPFDENLRAKCGISATEALEMVDWMKDALIERWENFEGQKNAEDALMKTGIDMIKVGKLEAWQASDEFKAAQAEAIHLLNNRNEMTLYANCVAIAKFNERFGNERTETFLRLFALRRGEVNGFRYFASPKPPNPTELAPLVIVEEKRVCAPMHAMLYNAVYDTFDDMLREMTDVKEKYLKTRGVYLEERVHSLIASMFPNVLVRLEKYYETNKQGNEHDGLLVVGRSLLVMEEKASEMKTPSRDVERSFRNLTDHFKSNRGIQHAYNQANRVIDIVNAASSAVAFYDAKGNVAAKIDPSMIDESFAICVTLESFGMLATDLTMILEVPADHDYPWVVNLYDLETLVDGFKRKGLSGDDFLRYLRHRRDFQGRLVSDDELNLAGQFISNGKMASPPRGTVELVMDSAQVFDDLYLQQHGFEGTYMTDAVTGGVTMDLRKSLQKGSAVFVGANSPIVRGEPKIGRNKACPCSSGKKYKKCCGSVV